MSRSFYIAGRLENVAQVQVVRDTLLARGWKCTYDWTIAGPITGSSAALQEVAEKEMKGVLTAEVVFVLLPGGRGTHVELGLAIAAQRSMPTKKIFIWAPTAQQVLLGTGRETCAFYHTCETITGPGDNAVFAVYMTAEQIDQADAAAAARQETIAHGVCPDCGGKLGGNEFGDQWCDPCNAKEKSKT